MTAMNGWDVSLANEHQLARRSTCSRTKAVATSAILRIYVRIYDISPTGNDLLCS